MYEKTTFRTATQRFNRKVLRLVLIVCLVGWLPSANAEWFFAPTLRAGGDFNDNPFQSIGTETPSESGYIAEASARFQYESQTSEFYIDPRVRTRNYGSNSELNSDDQFLRMEFNRDTPLTNFRIRTNYNRESVRTAERADTDFDIEDPDDIGNIDTGRTDLRDRRERLQITPSFLYRFTDVSAVSARLDYNDVRYDEAFQGQLTDYADTRLELAYRRSWTPRNTAIIGASFRNYQTDQGNNETDGIGFNLGFDRQISQTTRFRATAGLEDTEVLNADNEVEWVANVSLARRLETTNLIVQYRRSIAASGSGRLGARDSVNLNFTRTLSDKISAGIGARVYETRAVGGNLAGFDERAYVQLRSQFTWFLTEAFSIEANYRYTFLDRESLNESSNANEITLWFSYRPQQFSLSR